MNNKEALNNIKHDYIKEEVEKVINIVNKVKKYHEILYTDFLDPYEIKNIICFLNSDIEIKYQIMKEYSKNERMIIKIFLDYMDIEQTRDDDVPIKILKINSNSKFHNLNHKDYLGSLLSLGIDRRKIGDIVVKKDYAIAFVKLEISDYIYINLTKINNVNTKIDYLALDDIKKLDTKDKFEEKVIHISSNRIDGLVSSITNAPRKQGQLLIKRGFVKLNYEPIDSTSKPFDIGDLISIRGSGRFIIKEKVGNTKSGRQKILIGKLI